ncbi:uncharacterized protein LOC135471417 [Liolophura sinensis]|uniref:uncharacterized protein LOC135471417 n=1 Tax=Liolophura sinensis TaxID=3198878 RepID=UPI0031593D16
MVLLVKTSLSAAILMAVLIIPVDVVQVNSQNPATSEMVWNSGRSSPQPGRTDAHSKLLMLLFSQPRKVPKSDTVILSNVASGFTDYYTRYARDKKPLSHVRSFHQDRAEQYNSLQFLRHNSVKKFMKNIILSKGFSSTWGPANARVRRQASTLAVTPIISTVTEGAPSLSLPSVNVPSSSNTSTNIVPSPEPSPETRAGVDFKNKTTGRNPSVVVVENTSQSNATKISTSVTTLSQISVASGKGNKAGGTSSNTTPLLLVSRSSDASLNSSYLTENSSMSKFSRSPDNVTASTGEPQASATTDYTDTQILLTQTSPGSAGENIPTLTPEPGKPPLGTLTQGDITKPPPTTATSKTIVTQISHTSTGNTIYSNEKITTASPQSSAASSRVVTNGTAVDGKTSLPEPETSLPSSEPVPEGEGTPEPEAETMNPENNTEEPTAEPIIPFAEPVPNFEEAKKVWKEAWPIHIYSMGTAFSLLAVFSLISIIRLWRIKHLFSQKYFISLNLLMFLMGVIRGVYLLVDGYNSRQIFSRVLDYFLLSTGFPCLTSAFSILFFALLQATRMQLVGPKVQKIQVLIAIIVCHFGISIITDVVVGYFYGARIMLFLCELISVLWGLFLVIGYCYIFRRLYAAALKRQRVMERLSNVRSSRSPGVNGTSQNISDRKPSRTDSSVTVKPSQKYTLSLAVKVTLGTAILGLVYIGLEMFGMFGVFGVFSQKVPEPWPWWGFEFGLRLVELFMCVTMSYIGTQPFRPRIANQVGRSQTGSRTSASTSPI